MTISAPPVQTQLVWTASAQDEVRRRGLDAAPASLVLSPAAQVDDYVELSGPEGTSTFIVRRRFWSQIGGALLLRIELDHPPRPSGAR